MDILYYLPPLIKFHYFVLVSDIQNDGPKDCKILNRRER